MNIFQKLKQSISEEVAPFFQHYLTSKKYRKRTGFSEKRIKNLWEFDERG
ncbi:hypothetical protein JOC86_000095 [Bacillus pakistanensis]|uniref:Uncharacterized protein n=1 Tax=Rossellomorea pakistanensis TaxID=992288 RepID=A0ABS2N6V1_9BACI|nr:hypothetical protein [Bacillus pakistanensis]MBM7583558.1 hypothetical protein [Bacillus pakistanensis]